MSQISAALKLQTDNDAIISQTRIISHQLDAIKASRKLAGLPAPEFSDINSLTNCWIRQRYIPSVTALHQYFLASVQGVPTLGSSVNFTFNASNGQFTTDIVMEVKIGPMGDTTMDQKVKDFLVSGIGFDTAAAFRYAFCDLPGISLLERVSFKIAGRTVESYGRDEMLDYIFHELTAEKRLNFLRMIGQQSPQSFSYYNTDDETQVQIPYFSGAQTPKFYQDTLTMYIPIMFPWLMDPKQPMNNNFLPENNRTIEVTFANPNRIIRGVNAITGAVANLTVDKIPFKIQVFSRSLFIDDRIAPLFNTPRKIIVKSALSRSFRVDEGLDEIQLNSFSYPIEMLYVKFVPTANTDFVNNQAFAFTNWYKPAVITTRTQTVPKFTTIFPGPPILTPVTATSYEESDYVSNLQLQMADVGVYPINANGVFFSDYLAEINGDLLKTTRVGAYVIPFSQFYEGVLTDRFNGFLDASKIDNLILRWTAKDTSLIANLIVSIRFMNYYEPISGAIKFLYEAQN